MPTTHGRIRPATKYWRHPHSERSNDKLNFRFKLQRDRYLPPIPQHGLQGKASTHYEKRKESHRSHKQGWQPRKRHLKGTLNRRDMERNWTRQRTFKICQEPKNWAIEMCCAGNQNQNPDPQQGNKTRRQNCDVKLKKVFFFFFCQETLLTQNQAVLPRKNINNLGPSIASPHPDSIKGKVSKNITVYHRNSEIQQGTGFKV